MNISLTSELEQYVNAKVSSGMYTSASEVIRESLRLLHTYEDLQNQRIHQLNQSIEVGLSQLNTGNKISAKDSYNKLKKKIRKWFCSLGYHSGDIITKGKIRFLCRHMIHKKIEVQTKKKYLVRECDYCERWFSDCCDGT